MAKIDTTKFVNSMNKALKTFGEFSFILWKIKTQNGRFLNPYFQGVKIEKNMLIKVGNDLNEN